eukprot:1158882-Pelagomonas_calceolata.AAC.3
MGGPVCMAGCKYHARTGVGWGVCGCKGAANQPKLPGELRCKVHSCMVKLKREFVNLQASYGCLAGYASASLSSGPITQGRFTYWDVSGHASASLSFDSITQGRFTFGVQRYERFCGIQREQLGGGGPRQGGVPARIDLRQHA